MVNVYSTQLARLGSVPLGGYTAFVVPDGYACVLRDLDFFWQSLTETGTALGGFYVVTSSLPVLWGEIPALVNTPYPWRGRQILNPGELIEIFVSEIGWSFAASGYLLTLP